MSNPSAPDSKDISMADVSNASKLTDGNQQAPDIAQGEVPSRRRSTLILTDDIDLDRMNIDRKDEVQGSYSSNNDNQMHIDGSSDHQSQSEQHHHYNQHQQQPQQQPQPDANITLPVDIRWTQGGEKVYVTGSFTGWRKMIGLVEQPDNNFLITLGLPVGTHRFRFVVDNELRFSDFLPTATDQMGNFVNYIEVTLENVQSHLAQQEQQKQLEAERQAHQDQQQVGRKPSVSRNVTRSDSMWGLTNDDDDMGNGYSRYRDEDAITDGNTKYQYISDIPPIFTDPKVMEQYYIAIDKQSKSQNGQQAWLHPPQLPPHLEHVILNNFNSMDRDNNSGALPIPNHVVLNHLATTSIKHNTLAVASVVRYKRKYVTQVLYAPLQQ